MTPTQKRHYRVVAERTDAEHQGATTLTHFAYAESVEQAATLVRDRHDVPGGVYGGKGLYRVTKVEEVEPEDAEQLPPGLDDVAAQVQVRVELDGRPVMFASLLELTLRAQAGDGTILPFLYRYPEPLDDDAELDDDEPEPEPRPQPALRRARLMIEDLGPVPDGRS